MADCYKEREQLKNAYPNSPTWAEKVDKMGCGQVVAIFNKLRAQGKLGR